MKADSILGKITALATVLLLVWLAASGDGWDHSSAFTGQRPDRYNLLVDGFLKGQLSLDTPVHPDLLSPDPAIQKNAPYLLDAALYRGKYYLYYGAVPAVVLLLPYSWLTGHDLSLNVAVLFFGLVGYFVSLRLYHAARLIYFPAIGGWMEAACLLTLGLGSAIPVLVRRGEFYELPIAAGYAFLMTALLALFRVYHRQGRPLLWLGIASLSIGLAVGCRPNFIFALPVVAAAGLWLQAGTAATRPPRLSLAMAATLPAALLGVLLALYNHGRFGSPFDFGFNHGVNAFFTSGKPFVHVSFFIPNLVWYYLTLPVLSPFFPYCRPINAAPLPPNYYSDEAIHGQFMILCLLVVTVLAVLPLWRKLRNMPAALGWFLAGLAWIVVANLCFMCVLGVRADRYMVDFQAPLMLGLAIGGCLCWSRLPPGGLRSAWRGAFGFLAASASVLNVFNAIDLFDDFANCRPQTYRWLSYYGNYPSHWAGGLGLLEYGPIRFNVRFPPMGEHFHAPLLVAGTANKTDSVLVHQISDGSALFMLMNQGYGGAQSQPQYFDPALDHTIEVDLGSLYPPVSHPYYDGWAAADIERIKLTARLLLDGRPIIVTRLKTNDSPPGWVHFGRNPVGTGKPFSGTISAIERLPTRTPEALASTIEAGWWRARITLPEHLRRIGQPLLGSGVSGAGNLLFLEVLEKNRIRFGLDEWNAGASFSPMIEIDTSAEHRLEIFVGPQAVKQSFPIDWTLPPEGLAELRDRLHVWLDGQLVWSRKIIANLDSYDVANLGQNLQGFSSTARDYAGLLEAQPFTEAEQKDFLLRNFLPAHPQ